MNFILFRKILIGIFKNVYQNNIYLTLIKKLLFQWNDQCLIVFLILLLHASQLN